MAENAQGDLAVAPWGDGGYPRRVMGGTSNRSMLGTVTRRNLAVDVGVAVLVFGLTVGTLASGGLGTPDPDARALDGIGVALAAVSALPMLVWRLAPLAVYLATCVASIALVGLKYPLDFPVGPVVALYAVVVAGGDSRPAARRRATLLATAVFIAATTAVHLANTDRIRGSLPGLLFWALSFAGVWIAGEHTRLRRVRIDELEAQAARAEREAVRERRLAAAEERTRIARELHDSAGHAINVILVQAGAARLLHDRDPEGSRRAISTIETLARATIGEIDQLVRALRDDDAPELPVATNPSALDDLLERHRATGLAITTDVRGHDAQLPRSVTWAAYRILQEALTNAARHGCGPADVAVWFEPDAVEIIVTNPTANGSPLGGRRQGSVPAGGHGIVGMRERATLLGGSLEARSDNGVFCLQARLPHTKATP
jgi:signal transduction histidine kinase